MKKSFYFLFFIFISPVCFSQQFQPAIDGPPEDTAKIKLDIRKMFDKAEGFLLNENYDMALPLYDSLHNFDQSNANWDYKVGLCYLNSPTEFSKAVNFLENAAAKTSSGSKDDSYREDKAPVAAILYLGDAYHRNSRFEDAIETYVKYRKYIPERDKKNLHYLEYKIQVCKNAKELMADPINLILKNLGDSINSVYPDYAPVISADESILLFTSRRPENVGGLMEEN